MQKNRANEVGKYFTGGKYVKAATAHITNRAINNSKATN